MKKGSLALSIALLLSLAGVAVSALTIFEHVLIQLSHETGLTLESGFCSAGQTFNCKKVIGSEWSYLFGMPLGYYGVAFYLLLVALIVTAFDERFVKRVVAGAALFAFSVVAVGVSLFLYYISSAKIGALCPLCLTTYAINVLLMLVTFFVDRSLPLSSRLIEGLFGVVRFPLLLFRIGAPSDSLAPSLARVWLVGGLLGLLWIQALPDFIANQFVFPKAQSEQRVQKLAQAHEIWAAAPVQEIPLALTGGVSGDSFKGPLDAPVKVVEFSDYECPACRGAYAALEAVWAEFQGKVLLVHKDYPLDKACNANIPEAFHEYACLAAEVARCAAEQGKFSAVSDLLFRDPILTGKNAISEVRESLIRSSEALGVDSAALGECVASGRHREHIESDIALGDSLGVEGTPSFWINGKKVPVASPELIRNIILEILGTAPAGTAAVPEK